MVKFCTEQIIPEKEKYVSPSLFSSHKDQISETYRTAHYADFHKNNINMSNITKTVESFYFHSYTFNNLCHGHVLSSWY